MLHPLTMLARIIRETRFGADDGEYTNEYNSYRYFNDPPLDPVDTDTVHRYCNGGAGYENGPPDHFTGFNLTLVRLT